MSKHADTSKLTAEDWIILRLLTAAVRNRALNSDDYNKVVDFLTAKHDEDTVLAAASKIAPNVRIYLDRTLVPLELIDRACVAVGVTSALGMALQAYAIGVKRRQRWVFFTRMGDNNKYEVRKYDAHSVGGGISTAECIATGMQHSVACALRDALQQEADAQSA